MFRVLKNDRNIQRLYAFIKRSLQIALYFPPNMLCAILYIISKILQTKKELKDLLLNPQMYIKNETENSLLSSEDVNVSDKSNEDLEESVVLTNVTTELYTNEETKSEKKVENDTKIEFDKKKEYDPFCRNPLYAGITKGLNTELIALSKHYHPSVVLFANTIIEGTVSVYIL